MLWKTSSKIEFSKKQESILMQLEKGHDRMLAQTRQ